MFPLCCDPFGVHAENDHWEPVAQTHHVVSVMEDMEKALEYENLRSLCVACHGRVSAMERNGQDTKGLFSRQQGVVEDG